MSTTMQEAAPRLEELAPAFLPVAKRRRAGRRAAVSAAVMVAGALATLGVLHPWTGATATPGAPAAISRVAITGTGPGLAWVAARQEEWAERAVTGTGPGLSYLAGFQRHGNPPAVSGTGAGLERIVVDGGDQVATIGSP